MEEIKLGSTSHLFNNCGVIQIIRTFTRDSFELATNSGAKDFISTDKYHGILCKKDDFYKIKSNLEKKIKTLKFSGIEWRPLNLINLNKEQSEKTIEILESFEELDDVQNVFTNANLRMTDL